MCAAAAGRHKGAQSQRRDKLMTTRMMALIGGLVSLIGAVKIWTHIGAAGALSVQLCSGRTISLAVDQGPWWQSAHCWGCYALAFGLSLLIFASYQAWSKRRPVALAMD